MVCHCMCTANHFLASLRNLTAKPPHSRTSCTQLHIYVLYSTEDQANRLSPGSAKHVWKNRCTWHMTCPLHKLSCTRTHIENALALTPPSCCALCPIFSTLHTWSGWEDGAKLEAVCCETSDDFLPLDSYQDQFYASS